MKPSEFVILALAWVLMVSCSPGLPQDPTASYQPANPPEPRTLQNQPAGSDGFRQITPGIPQATTTSQPDFGRDTLLQLRSGTTVTPKDYRIGSLSDGTGPEQRAARESLVRFLTSLKESKADMTVVHSQWKTLITSTLEIQKSNWPASFRIGPLALESEDTVRATVALTGPEGRADGWIYLEREGQNWRISDWQVDLLSPAAESKELFDPEGFPLVRGFP